MNQNHNAGAINARMIVNLLLVASIAAAIYVMLSRTGQNLSGEYATPVPRTAPTIRSKSNQLQPVPATTDDADKEIAALRKQLQSENLKLETLRAREKRVEEIRSGTQQSADQGDDRQGKTNASGQLITPMGIPEQAPDQ